MYICTRPVRLPPAPHPSLNRRSFLHSAGASAFVCALGGGVPATRAHIAKADAAAAALKQPTPIAADPVDSLKFGTPQPQPGGVGARVLDPGRVLQLGSSRRPGRDEWMKMPIPAQAQVPRVRLPAVQPGLRRPARAAVQMPGPTLEAEVGDTIVVHFRNADEHFGQALTMHPHGVRYTPDYDGSYLGNFTRAGGFIAPGEEFTYTWECTPDSVGVWPYHDHGPNHTINIARGLFGAIIVREKGAKAPDVEEVLVLHQLPPQVTGAAARLPVHQRPRVRGQHADDPRARSARTSRST